MEIRRAVVADAERIAEVHVLGWQIGYRGLLPQSVLDELHPSQRVPRWTRTTTQATWPGRGTLLAEEGDALLGFADVRPTQDSDLDPRRVGEIASFYVLPTAWGRGVGRALMAAALESLGAAGFGGAALWVQDTNVRALGFYRHLGWVPDGSVRADVVGEATIHDRRYRHDLG